MSGLLLTEAEKRRFVEWLRMNAESSRAMLTQLSKAGLPDTVVDAISKRERTMIAACTFLADHIESGESVSIVSAERTAE